MLNLPSLWRILEKSTRTATYLSKRTIKSSFLVETQHAIPVLTIIPFLFN